MTLLDRPMIVLWESIVPPERGRELDRSFLEAQTGPQPLLFAPLLSSGDRFFHADAIAVESDRS